MPQAGAVLAGDVQARMLANIDRVFEKAATAADVAGFDQVVAKARAPFELAEITREEALAFVDDFEKALLWKDEGNCFNRAMWGVHHLNNKVGVGTSPLDDVFAGAVAIRHHYHAGPDYTGGFHAVAAVKVKGEGVMVVDRLPGNDKLVPYAEWAAGREADTFLIRPWAGSGIERYAGGPKRSEFVTRPYFEWAKGELQASVRKFTEVAKVAEPAAAAERGAGAAAAAAEGGGAAAADAVAKTGGWWSNLSSGGKVAVVAGGIAVAAIGAKLLLDRD